MVKNAKAVKRVYEKGKETTVLILKKKVRPKIAAKKVPASRIKKTVKVKPVKTLPAQTAVSLAVKKPFVDHYDLPHLYNTTQVSLLVKDPFWLYAYWEVSSQSWQEMRNKFPELDFNQAKVTLRMYDISMIDFNGSNAHSYFDIEVNQDCGNWYVNLWQENISYVGEIGLKTQNGSFYPIARSNCVQPPRSSHSERSEQIWMQVKDETYQQPYALAARTVYRHNSQKQVSDEPRRIIHISDEDIRNYYYNLSALLREIISARLNKLYGRKAGKYSFLLQGESEWERKKFLSLFPEGYSFQRIKLGASEEMVIVKERKGEKIRTLDLFSGASDLVQKMQPREFFFELNTELIVYGRTEPGARVFLGDKKIDLRSDGTFTLRLALPDGKIPLEFKALSADGKESRQIYTYVERNTNV